MLTHEGKMQLGNSSNFICVVNLGFENLGINQIPNLTFALFIEFVYFVNYWWIRSIGIIFRMIFIDIIENSFYIIYKGVLYLLVWSLIQITINRICTNLLPSPSQYSWEYFWHRAIAKVPWYSWLFLFINKLSFYRVFPLRQE